MAINTDAWLQRARTFQGRVGLLHAPQQAAEAVVFAVSMATEFYGVTSQQVQTITQQADNLTKRKDDIVLYEFAKGWIKNMAAEIEAGLIQNLRLSITGEILTDLLALAREALSNNTVPVAAVLTAAAFEDLMRRLALEKIGLTQRIKLEQVLNELKDKKVLQGGEPAVAQGFLKFRNDSLHADWNNVTEAQVTSCLGLMDNLVVKHLS
jgi:hypothetical protein